MVAFLIRSKKKMNMAIVRFGKHLDTVVEIVGEKEMPIERHGVSDALVLCRFNDGKLEFIPKDNLDNMDYDPIDREQRRYEIAKDVMAAYMSNGDFPESHSEDVIARWSTMAADRLIDELKKDNQG